MLTAFKNQKYTLEEYFDLELLSQERLEFWDGNVWSMAGASPEHERIVVNTGAHLRDLLRGRKCSIFGSNLKVVVPRYPPYRYPDLTVVCGESKYETMGGMKVLTNPEVIIEILSPSTESFDRSDKFSYYQSIPSFTAYIMIAANRPKLTQLIKKNEGEWMQHEANGSDGKLHLPTFNIDLLLSEIYLDIEFSDPLANIRLVEG